MSNDRLRQIANVIALVGVLATNFLAEAVPLNGFTSAQIANRYPDLLYFPANYAFSIWSVIYVFLIAFGVYQALPAQRENPALRRIGWLFVASSILNAGWLISFHYLQFPLSMLMMILLLATLITIYLRLDIGGKPVSRATKWLIHVPFSLYLGWITAATITNAAYTLVEAGWNGFGIDAQTWALIMLTITGLLAAYVVYTRRDIAYGLVIIWAVTAIAVRHVDVMIVNMAAIVVSIAVALLVLYAIWSYFNARRLGWSM